MNWQTKILNAILGVGGYEAMPLSASDHDFKNLIRRGEGALTNAGVPVTAETGMRVSAVNACVRILSECMAGLPIKVFRNSDDGSKEEIRGHRITNIFAGRPNPWQTGFILREWWMTKTVLRGNAIWLRIKVAGKTEELWPIDPTRVQVKQQSRGSLLYEVAADSNSPVATNGKTFAMEEIFHKRGISTDGILGRSVIGDAREGVGIANAQEVFGGRLYGNGAHFTGILQHPGELKGKARENLEKSLEGKTGLDSSQGIFILEDGMKYERTSMSAEDAQFLDARKFQLEEISRMFRVPPSMIGATANMPRSNVEEESRKFVMYSLAPWIRRSEAQIKQDLLIDEGEEDLVAEYNVAGLLRGDLKGRFESYALGKMNGWLSVNDIRRMENMDRVEGGDNYLEPLNMIPINESRKERDNV